MVSQTQPLNIIFLPHNTNKSYNEWIFAFSEHNSQRSLSCYGWQDVTHSRAWWFWQPLVLGACSATGEEDVCGIEVEGGKVPTKDWFVNLQILTSGGFQ